MFMGQGIEIMTSIRIPVITYPLLLYGAIEIKSNLIREDRRGRDLNTNSGEYDT